MYKKQIFKYVISKYLFVYVGFISTCILIYLKSKRISCTPVIFVMLYSYRMSNTQYIFCIQRTNYGVIGDILVQEEFPEGISKMTYSGQNVVYLSKPCVFMNMWGIL